MDAALSVILTPFGFLCKAKPLLLQIGGPSLSVKINEFSITWTHSPWILERGATVYEKRICTSLPSSLRIAWNGVLKPRHFLGVRLAVRTMSWISSSDILSMSV
jgi:hypothetical protein